MEKKISFRVQSSGFSRVVSYKTKNMGYEIVRFVGDIDPDFLCQMCKSVLENPVQIPCDHLFCYDCIKHRISNDRTCPVDLSPIKLCREVQVFKAPCMAFRNLLYKLNIKCDFRKTKFAFNLSPPIRTVTYFLLLQKVWDARRL